MVTILALLLTKALAATTLTLSQRDVAEMVLKQSPKAKEVTLTYEQNYLPYLSALSVTDWKLNLASGYEYDKTQTFLYYGTNSRYQRYITTASVSKYLLTGTNLTLNVGKTSQKTDLIGTTIPPQADLDTYSFNVEQYLWGNSFGWGDRAAIDQANYAYLSQDKLRANDLQNVVLDALKQFWNTYVAQENFREALAARDRYERLVKAVSRKTSLGYSNPGELSQIRAEYEAQIQAVKTASASYLQNVDAMITLLDLPAGTELNFVVPKELPPVPKLAEKALDDLRAVKSQQYKVKAAREGLSVAKSAEKPVVNFVGKYSGSGLDADSATAYSQLVAGTHPEYYAGLRLQYNFGSGVLDEGIHAKKAALSLEETRLARLRNEQRDTLTNAERQVGSTYTVAQSSTRQRMELQKAVEELTRTYNQGRTDISLLITAMDKLFAAEVGEIRSIGDYEIALNQWAAARDELIPDSGPSEDKK